MMPRVYWLVVLGLLLAGCAGQQAAPSVSVSAGVDTSFSGQPAGNPPQPSAEPSATFSSEQATIAAFQQAPPPAGTAIAPLVPNANDVLVFDTLEYTRTGGFAGGTLTLLLNSDGTFLRDAVAGRVDASVVAGIDRYLDQIRFFGLSGTFTSPAVAPDAYQYHIRVSRAGEAWAIFSDDVYTPPELKQLYALLERIGAAQAPTG